MSHQLNLAILLGSAVMLVGAVAVRLSSRLGLPSLLVYLALGLALGESGLGIRFDNAELTRHLGLGALILIIAEGGLASRWRSVRPALAPATVLATFGVLVSVAVLGVLDHVLLGFGWQLALLYGAVLSSTDAVITMVLRDGEGFVPVRRTRLKTQDALLIVSTQDIRDQVEERIEEVSRLGPLARWLS